MRELVEQQQQLTSAHAISAKHLMLVAYKLSPMLSVTSQTISVIVELLFPNTQQTEVTHGYRRASWLSSNNNNNSLPQLIVISAGLE